MTQQPRRHLAAVMFTDVVGYTALMQHDEEAALAARSAHRTAVASAAAVHDGNVVQHYGDGSLTLYPSPLEAVLAAIEIHFPQAGPTRRVRRLVPPLPAIAPSVTSGTPNSASGVQNRKSQEAAISNPAPRQIPWAARMMGFSMASNSS